MNEAVQQVIEKAAGVSPSGETVWFWLVFAAVFLMAGTEVLTNLLWKNSSASFSHLPTSVVISTGMAAAAGVAFQILLWQVGVTRMESALPHSTVPNRKDRQGQAARSDKRNIRPKGARRKSPKIEAES